jgi:hypothetical protein
VIDWNHEIAFTNLTDRLIIHPPVALDHTSANEGHGRTKLNVIVVALAKRAHEVEAVSLL